MHGRGCAVSQTRPVSRSSRLINARCRKRPTLNVLQAPAICQEPRAATRPPPLISKRLDANIEKPSNGKRRKRRVVLRHPPPPPRRRPRRLRRLRRLRPRARRRASLKRKSSSIFRASIRQVLATYERAIEGENIDLFRQVKPNLSADEAKRLQTSFDTMDASQMFRESWLA